MFFVVKNKKVFFVLVVICILMMVMKSETYGQDSDLRVEKLKVYNKIIEKRKSYIEKIIENKSYLFKTANIFYKNEKVDVETVQVLNRIYVPAEAFCKSLNEEYEFDKEKNTIKVGDCKIDIEKRSWFKEKSRTSLRGEILFIGDHEYISLIDVCEILNLYTSWAYKGNIINLYEKKNIKLGNLDLGYNENVEEDGAIRLEDVAAGDVYLKEGNLEKLRVVGDMLKKNNVPYHIAWVPRYVFPEKGVDNDLLKVNNFVNAEFIYTLDYLVNRGALIGLHGYTHQYGNAESIIGSEFEDKSNLTIEEKKKKVKDAINTAQLLNIPYRFFETPHYRSNAEFQTMLEGYFNYIYEPCIGKWNQKPYLSERNNKTVYIPAPLSYVQDEDVESLFNRLKEGKGKKLASFFYHPTKEFKYIDIRNDGNNIVYTYGESPMKRIIKRFNEEGIKFNYINKLEH